MLNYRGKAPSLFNLMAVGLVILALNGLGSAQGHAAAVRWGAVGHDDRIQSGSTYAYNAVPISQQMALLKAIGAKWIRTSCEPATCDTLLQQTQANGIGILRSIEMWPDSATDEMTNYYRAYHYALGESTKYRGKFKYYEAGNEADVWVGMTGDGSNRSQYNQHRYVQARGLISGLIDGIRAGDPSAQILVDDAGWCHYGFLKALSQDGLRWDITAFHWYSAHGNMEHAGCGGVNVVAMHASFGLPVWITEFNSNTAAEVNDEQAAAMWISQFMTQVQTVASKYGIEGAFAFELLDESTIPGIEAHLGLYYSNGKPKPAATAVAKLLNAATTAVPSAPLAAIPSPPTNLQVQTN
jgi:hypothetical protein